MDLLLANYEAHEQIFHRLEALDLRKLNYIQHRSIVSKLFQGRNLLVCAPTSSGKTLIGELACVNAILNRRGRCLYLVPLKSLANEKLEEFNTHWERLGIQVEMSTGDLTLQDREKEGDKLKSVDLLITTYERADSILRTDPEWFKQVSVIVVDEIHTIGAERRGARLEGLLLRLKFYSERQLFEFPQFQFICLSATVGNPEELAEWMGCELIKHDFRPVPLDYEIAFAPNRDEKIKEVTRKTLQEKGSILIFTPTRYESVQTCKMIANYVREQELSYLFEYRQLRDVINKFQAKIHGEVDRTLLYAIPNGVAFHHAGVSYETKHFIEELFRQGLVKVVSCTPTLSAGVNLPAKVVIVKDAGLTRPYLRLSANRLHQMCGRAGRPQFDTRGKAIILAAYPGEENDIKLMYFRRHTHLPKYDPTESQLMEEDFLLEQVMIWVAEQSRPELFEGAHQKKRLRQKGVKERDLQQMVYETFWYQTAKRRQPDATVQHLIRIGAYTLENLLMRHSTAEVVENARQIPDDAVKIRQMDAHQMEAIIYDRVHMKVLFNRRHPSCPCGKYDHQNPHKAVLCRHLVKLARVAYRRAPDYTKNLLVAALHEERIMETLQRLGLVRILNGRYAITELGYKAFTLYLQPKTAHAIRRLLPRIQTKERFYFDLMYVYGLERRPRKKEVYQKALEQLLGEEYLDLRYHMRLISTELKIPLGDLEEFVDSMRWILHCFYSLASLDQVNPALEWAGEGYTRLSPLNLRLIFNYASDEEDLFQIEELKKFLERKNGITKVYSLGDEAFKLEHPPAQVILYFVTKKALATEACGRALALAIEQQTRIILIRGPDVTDLDLSSVHPFDEGGEYLDLRQHEGVDYDATDFPAFCEYLHGLLERWRLKLTLEKSKDRK
jgi:replicative superfamily II helicase